ncbi:MAG: exonuclease domain-containing protein [Candidatus Kapaibacterium sp.]
MKLIKLKKPIIFLDLETTGLNVESDRIVEIAMIKHLPNGKEDTIEARVNPGMTIPAEATNVHGISDEDVKDSPHFSKIATSIYTFIQGCDIVGYNCIAFDIPLLLNELRRCGYDWDYSKVSIIDVGNLYKIFEPRTLEKAVEFYLQRHHDGAHGAMADTKATTDVFTKMLNQYGEISNCSISELARKSNYDRSLYDLAGRFTENEEGVPVFNFGKYKGAPVSEKPNYIEWMLLTDFPDDTKRFCRIFLKEKNINGG